MEFYRIDTTITATAPSLSYTNTTPPLLLFPLPILTPSTTTAGNYNEDCKRVCYLYGTYVGQAFQLIDDALDFEGAWVNTLLLYTIYFVVGGQYAAFMHSILL